MKTDYLSFDGREGRARYIVEHFAPLLRGSVLDVGFDTRRLKALIPDSDYVGIDIGGDPDIRINLEQHDRLPFDDNQFDAVVCTDVLEHLDSLHHVFDEMVRVCRGKLIISLPNPWNNLRKRIPRGRGTPRYYGLPAQRPDDRHKWFFNVTDQVAFMQAQTTRHPLTIESQRVNIKPRPPLANQLIRAVHLSRMRYLNRYAHTLWTVLRKIDGAASTQPAAVR